MTKIGNFPSLNIYYMYYCCCFPYVLTVELFKNDMFWLLVFDLLLNVKFLYLFCRFEVIMRTNNASMDIISAIVIVLILCGVVGNKPSSKLKLFILSRISISLIYISTKHLSLLFVLVLQNCKNCGQHDPCKNSL